MTYNIARTVLSSLLTAPDKIVVEDDQRALSRRALFANIISRIEVLTASNVTAGDFVVVLCDRGMSFWIDLLALWVIGARPICLESQVETAHGENVKALTDVKFLSASLVQTPDVFSELTALPAINFEAVADLGGALSLKSFPFVKAPESDLAGLIFTSGTTGLPKGVPLTHTMLVQNALGTATRLGLRPADKLMIATPFRFISSISHFIVTLLSGATFYGTEDKLMAADLVARLGAKNITSFGGSPFHAGMISRSDKESLPDLRWIMSSGDHLPVEVIDRLHSAFPHIKINTVYGMAELAGRFCVLPPEFVKDHKGSVGYPISGLELVLINDDGEECDYNEIGALYARGTIAFPGYYKNDAANEKVMTPYGFKTGDVGYFNKSGFLHLSGRSDSVFKRSGLKVSSQVITDAILALNLFDDAIVLSREDAIEGRVPVAYVTAQDQSLTKGGLLRQLRPVLPNNHLPKALIYLPTIPRTGSGKVDRRKLHALVDSLSG